MICPPLEEAWYLGLTRPSSIALVGISPRPGFATTVLRNLEAYGYEGEVHPVNPAYEELHGRTCYPSVNDISAGVDLALIFRAASAVPEAVADCGRAGVKVAIVYASGFAEVGSAGEALQRRTAEVAREYGVRLLGPNCQGWFHRASGVAAAFTMALDGRPVPSSGVAYVGQSGAIGGALMALAAERGLGFEAWASVGNELDLQVAELAGRLLADDSVTVLAMYLESVPDGRAWLSLLQDASRRGKHLVLLRSGRSERGRRAAASHTGAMVRSDVAFSLVNHRWGVIEVHDVLDLVETLDALSIDPTPVGHSVAVVTSSGGAGAMVADELDGTPLRLSELSGATRNRLAALVPAYGSLENPVDVTAQLFSTRDEALAEVYAAVAADVAVDVVLVVLTGASNDLANWIAKRTVGVVDSTDTRFVVVWMVPDRSIEEARQLLRSAGVYVTASIASAVRLLTRLQATGRAEPDSAQRISDGPGLLRFLDPAGHRTEAAAGPFLDAIGIARPDSRLATTEQEATATAVELGCERYVLKIQSPRIAHKSDVGGVLIGIDPPGVADAYRAVLAAGDGLPVGAVEGVLVQAMHPTADGVDLLVGVQGVEHGYPPVVTVGLGGVAAEIHQDIVSGLAPLDARGARDLLQQLRSWPLLDGYRGRPRVAVDEVVEVLAAVSEAAVLLGPGLGQLEINPLHVGPYGVAALDVLLTSNGPQ